MHRVWSIAELEKIILSHCTSGSLSALARTSKYFKDPALNQLWGHCHIDARWLLNLLPPESWEKLVPADLALFSDYAKRVIHLRLSASILPDLMRQLPKPICPNLRSLTSRFNAGDAECDFIIQLLGPNVDSISLDNCSRMKPQSAASLFSYIGRCHPSIKVFQTTLGDPNPSSHAVNEAIGAAIVELIAPSYVAVTDPSPATMAHIAASKTIEHLKIQRPTEQAFQSLIVNGNTQFTNLSRLSLAVFSSDISCVCHLISAIPPERLQSFTLNVYDYLTSLDELRMLLQELGQRHSSTMRIISVINRWLVFRSPSPLHSVLDLLREENYTAFLRSFLRPF